MGVMVFIVLVTLAISLYDFISSRDNNRLSKEVSAEKNKKYGAYAIRNSYNLVLSIILGFIFIIFLGWLFAQRGFSWSLAVPEEKTEQSDTFLLTINAPPVEHIETLPPSHKLSGKEGQGTPSEARQAQPEPPAEETPPKPDKIAENTEAAEKPKTSNPEKPKKYSSIEEQIKAEERKYLEEFGGEKKREDIRKKAEERKRQEEEKKKNAQASQASKQNDGGNNGAKGMPMASFELAGRKVLEQGEFLDNPGYTCPQGVAGKVVIKIKVNSSGNVTSAEPVNLEKLNPCLAEQSRLYAKKSRFSPASAAMREGTITYVFAP